MSLEDPDERDPLQSLIAEVLEAQGRGESFDREALIHANPDYADSLREFFASHDHMKSAADLDASTLQPRTAEQASEDPTIAPLPGPLEDQALPPTEPGEDHAMNHNPHQSSGGISAEIPTVSASIWRRPIFIVGITLTLIAFLGLPLGFRLAPFGILFLWWMPDDLPAFVRLFLLWSPVVFAIGLVIIVVGTSASATLCALAISLVALAASARPFMAPHICGMVALFTSMIGIALTVYDCTNEPVRLRTLSITANALVAILSALLVTRIIRRHIIDILERGYDVVLTAIGLAPLGAFILLAVACIQAGRRVQRIVEGQGSPPPA